MKKALTKKLLSGILAATMLFSMGANVFANESGERVCVSETIYKEITNINALIELAIDQIESRPVAMTTDENGNDFYVDQLLAKKEFSDGSKEYTSVRTGITILDKNGKMVLPEQIVKGKIEEAITNGSVTLTLSMYISSKVEAGSVAGVLVHRLDKSVSTINFVGSASSYERPVSCAMIQYASSDRQQYKSFTLNTVNTNTVTFPSTDTGFYSTDLGAFVLQSTVKQYGGNTFSHTIALPANFDPDPYGV